MPRMKWRELPTIPPFIQWILRSLRFASPHNSSFPSPTRSEWNFFLARHPCARTVRQNIPCPRFGAGVCVHLFHRAYVNACRCVGELENNTVEGIEETFVHTLKAIFVIACVDWCADATIHIWIIYTFRQRSSQQRSTSWSMFLFVLPFKLSAALWRCSVIGTRMLATIVVIVIHGCVCFGWCQCMRDESKFAVAAVLV